MLLRSSPGFFPGGFFVLRRKCGFLDFVLLFGEESLPLEEKMKFKGEQKSW